jgi:hypothetical protein
MGTNFYARRIIPAENDKVVAGGYIDSADMADAIESDSFGGFDSIAQYVNEGNEVHLGKRSAGWKFLWNPNVFKIKNRLRYTYPLTKQGITDFLKQEGMVITDEYGKTYEPDEFLAMAFNWCVDGLDAKEYYTSPRYGADWCYPDDPKIIARWKRLGFNPEYYNFYSDGLVFSTCVNFC